MKENALLPEDDYDRYEIVKFTINEVTENGRKAKIHYRDPGSSNHHVQDYALKELVIIEEQGKHFFRELVVLNGHQTPQIVGLAKKALTPGEMLNIKLKKKILREDLLKEYLSSGSPQLIFLEKGFLEKQRSK